MIFMSVSDILGTTDLYHIKGVSSPVGTRGHAATVNNEIVMNLFMNLFLVT